MTQTETLAVPAMSNDFELGVARDAEQTNGIGALAGALAKAQANITSPPRNREVTVKMKSGGTYKFKYATLDSIIDHVRGPLTANGLWFTQTLEGDDNGKYRLITALIHSSGQSIKSETPLLVVEAGNQAFGSALTYMRRYALCSILGVAADEDDDANSAEGNVAASKPAGNTAKWKGPLAVTKLKAAFGDFVKALAECKNLEAVKSLVASNDAMLDQLKADKPEWYNGAGDVMGVDDRVQARKRALEVEPDPFTGSPDKLHIIVPEPNDGGWDTWLTNMEAGLDKCEAVGEVNALNAANTFAIDTYKRDFRAKATALSKLFELKREALQLAPAEDPS